MSVALTAQQKEMEMELLVLRETKVMQQNKILGFESVRMMFSERTEAARIHAEEVELFIHGLRMS